MKVDNALTPLVGTPVKSAKTGASGSTDKTSAAPQDNVHLGSLSSKVEGGAPPFDRARVEAIKQAISQGHFKINPEKIADGLIASAKELVAG